MGLWALVNAGKYNRDHADKQACAIHLMEADCNLNKKAHLWLPNSEHTLGGRVCAGGTVQPGGGHNRGDQGCMTSPVGCVNQWD